MTFTYPAVFTEKEDGTGYHAFFPDLEMCEADGADLEDAIENARDAAQNWISVELEEFEGDLPFATRRASGSVGLILDIFKEYGVEPGLKVEKRKEEIEKDPKLATREYRALRGRRT